MLWATYLQQLDPLAGKCAGSVIVSTFFASLPVLVLFYLLVPRRWLAPKAGAAAAAVALLVAVVVYGMSPLMAGMAFVHGAAFGLLPVGWTIFNAMLLYNVTVQSGKFDLVRRSVAGLSADARIQAILIAFSFGAFLEGAAGGGTPVAICGAIMVGLGFNPFLAAVLCLIANTSPVAYGGLGTPLIVLSGVTDIDTKTLSVMAGHQLPLLSLFVPLYMIRCMCNWRQTFEVWPALLVAGGSFAIFQYFFATSHLWIDNLVLYPMTDIGGGIFSLVVTALFLRVWKPRTELILTPAEEPAAPPAPIEGHGGHDAEAEAAQALLDEPRPAGAAAPLTVWNVTMAWMPFVLMSIALLLTGLVRQREPGSPGKPFVTVAGVQTNYLMPIPFLHEEVERDPRLRAEGKSVEREKALFNFAWLTAPGTAVFLAALASMVMLRMRPGDILAVFRRTCVQMKIPIPTIAFMLGLSYVTRYAGMDATLGLAFASTGLLYPFFAPLLGWLGVFLTGTDAGSNALFGSLQQITATEIHKAGAMSGLDLGQAQVLICTSNSTGGVMGKMIDAQSIVVATAATHQLGREADIFKAVVWHSILLACVVGLITLLQAYVAPFTGLVPHP
ncbi:MAG: lactate permease LctP family transporter [Gemmataceae bacterium]